MLSSFFQRTSVRVALSSLFAELSAALSPATAVVEAPEVEVTDSSPAEPPPTRTPAEVLTELLSDPAYKWRSLGQLNIETGLYGDDLDALLVTVGARIDRRGKLAGLISRVGHGPNGSGSGNPLEAQLRKLLQDPNYKWRKSETLCKKLGVTGAELEPLLEAVDARASKTDDELFGLRSRVDDGNDSSDEDDDDDEDDEIDRSDN